MRDHNTKTQIKANTKNKLRDNTQPLSPHPNPDMKQPPPVIDWSKIYLRNFLRTTDTYLEPSRISMMRVFNGNSERLQAVNCFQIKARSYIFD